MESVIPEQIPKRFLEDSGKQHADVLNRPADFLDISILCFCVDSRKGATWGCDLTYFRCHHRGTKHYQNVRYVTTNQEMCSRAVELDQESSKWSPIAYP